MSAAEVRSTPVGEGWGEGRLNLPLAHELALTPTLSHMRLHDRRGCIGGRMWEREWSLTTFVPMRIFGEVNEREPLHHHHDDYDRPGRVSLVVRMSQKTKTRPACMPGGFVL